MSCNFYRVSKNYELNEGRRRESTWLTMCVIDYYSLNEHPRHFAQYVAEERCGSKVRFVMGAFHSGATVQPYWSLARVNPVDEVDILIVTSTADVDLDDLDFDFGEVVRGVSDV